MSSCGAPRAASDRTRGVDGRLAPGSPAGTSVPARRRCGSARTHGSDGLWQRYVISQGTNIIVGVRNGSRADVVLQVEEMVTRLNERRLGKLRAKTR